MKAKDFKELDFSPWETDYIFDITTNKKIEKRKDFRLSYAIY
jgi:hypothetical protein